MHSPTTPVRVPVLLVNRNHTLDGDGGTVLLECALGDGAIVVSVPHVRGQTLDDALRRLVEGVGPEVSAHAAARGGRVLAAGLDLSPVALGRAQGFFGAGGCAWMPYRELLQAVARARGPLVLQDSAADLLRSLPLPECRTTRAEARRARHSS